MGYTGSFRANERRPPLGLGRSGVQNLLDLTPVLDPPPAPVSAPASGDSEQTGADGAQASSEAGFDQMTVAQLDQWAAEHADVATEYPSGANKPEKITYLKSVTASTEGE
jgi:hypothetical protein